MTKYETKSNIGTKSDYDRAIYRNGELVGEIGYSDITDCTAWYFIAPNGLQVSEGFDDAMVTAEDIIEKIKMAYGEE